MYASSVTPSAPVGTLSSLPNWKTAKMSSFDASILSLLGNSTTTAVHHEEDIFVGQDGVAGGSAIVEEPVYHLARRDQRRYSTPVLALQKPVVTAQSQQEAAKSKRVSFPTSIPWEQPETSEGRAVSVLQRVLTET